MPWGTREERYFCSGGAKVGLGAVCTVLDGAERSAGAAVPAALAAGRGEEVPVGSAAGCSALGVDRDGALGAAEVELGLPGEVQPAAARTAAARSTIPRDFERPLYMGCFLSRAVLI